MLAVFLIAWSVLQLGGLSVFLINSWLLLSLPLVLAASGVTLVIFTGEFDLSAAGVVAVTNVLMATWLSELGWLGLPLAVLVGAVVGLFNGFLVVVMRLPAIAVTLATFIILGGLALVILPTPGGRIDPGIIDFFTGQLVVPRSIIFLMVIALLWLLYRNTRMGVHAYGVGQDAEALRLSGVAVDRVKFGVFALAGTLYGLAGAVLAAVVQTGDATIGSSYLLATFAAVAIGGAAFTGGSGSVLGTMLGALTLTVIPKVLFVLGISGWVQRVFEGMLIIAAVLVGAVATQSEQRKVQAVKTTPKVEAPTVSVSGGERP
ncbi:ABC transporter permease [Microcella alkalica]|uniref:ABC transporter permease n=1 Tax=Microcella alkalica TaxID=355930 RepID=UPI0031DA75E7